MTKAKSCQKKLFAVFCKKKIKTKKKTYIYQHVSCLLLHICVFPFQLDPRLVKADVVRNTILRTSVTATPSATSTTTAAATTQTSATVRQTMCHLNWPPITCNKVHLHCCSLFVLHLLTFSWWTQNLKTAIKQWATIVQKLNLSICSWLLL